MITMLNKHDIISMYRREGRSLRDIAKTLHLHRATVTKVIREYEASLSAENPQESLTEVLTTEPAYHSRSRPARTLTKEVTDEIDRWLAENDRRRSKGMRKQCLNAKEIHRQLLEKDIVVSYSSVCKYNYDFDYHYFIAFRLIPCLKFNIFEGGYKALICSSLRPVQDAMTAMSMPAARRFFAAFSRPFFRPSANFSAPSLAISLAISSR